MFVIKPFSEKYVPLIRDLLIEVCLTEYKCHQWNNAAFMTDWKSWILNQNYSYYNFYPRQFLLAFDDMNNLLGFISLKKIDSKIAEIKKLYVRKEYRHSGVAQKLFADIAKEAFKLGSEVESIQAVICVPFIEAINFFEKSGFKITYFDELKLEYKVERNL